jgi:type I restriction enzyme M protein
MGTSGYVWQNQYEFFKTAFPFFILMFDSRKQPNNYTPDSIKVALPGLDISDASDSELSTMTGQQLKQLENRLWEAADQLRANSKLTATEYSFPVLGLIFLRHAYNRFSRRPITKEDFIQAKAIFLPEQSQWKYLADLPEGADIGQVIDEAMRQIEAEYEILEGVLPKNYSLFEKQLLQRLVRIFNTEQLDNVSGDVFGRIYEYFLNKFAMSGASEGGEFFTPPSLVKTIVNIIEPDHGIVFDPACGSAGMFVQTGHFIEEEGLDPSAKVTFYGQEKAETNTKLAKMNMVVHGLEGDILQGNTFYEDQHDLVGKCDFVMANPPFNVDGVDKKRDFVKKDARLPFGLPRNDNANYLWIQYFYGYLNEKGRAGFVMASSASDAGHSEKEIRKELVETGAVDVMVSIGTKFFYTRSLPCALWFFDREKANDPERADKTLMLDLRDVYRKVSSSLHDFTDEQLRNIQAIVKLYRGNTEFFRETVAEYQKKANDALAEANETFKMLLKADADLKVESDALKLETIKERKRTVINAINTRLAALKVAKKEADKSETKALDDIVAKLSKLEIPFKEAAERAAYFNKEYQWLTKRFPDATYTDVPGLCKVVSQEEIADNDFSLTPGRYVGVAPQIDEDFDYEERMKEIKVELQGLNEEATELAQRIQDNLNELGL